MSFLVAFLVVEADTFGGTEFGSGAVVLPLWSVTPPVVPTDAVRFFMFFW